MIFSSAFGGAISEDRYQILAKMVVLIRIRLPARDRFRYLVSCIFSVISQLRVSSYGFGDEEGPQKRLFQEF